MRFLPDLQKRTSQGLGVGGKYEKGTFCFKITSDLSFLITKLPSLDLICKKYTYLLWTSVQPESTFALLKEKMKIIPYFPLEIAYLTIHTLEFLVENCQMPKGSDVSDCYLLLQKTFAYESFVSCHQRCVNCPPNCLQNCP